MDPAHFDALVQLAGGSRRIVLEGLRPGCVERFIKEAKRAHFSRWPLSYSGSKSHPSRNTIARINGWLDGQPPREFHHVENACDATIAEWIEAGKLNP